MYSENLAVHLLSPTALQNLHFSFTLAYSNKKPTTMQEEVNMYIDMGRESMDEAISRLQRELSKVRTGKASPAMLNGLKVDYYGSSTPLNQVSNVSTSDAKTIVIKPYEKSMLAPIEKSIFEANLGLTPQNNGEIIMINIPPLTEERRKEYVKRAKALGEESKVSLRNTRREMMDGIKKAVKDGFPEDAGKRKEDEIDDITKEFTGKIDKLIDAKEKDIMTI